MSRQNRDSKLRRFGWGTLLIFRPDLAERWWKGRGRPKREPYDDLKLVTDIAIVCDAENCGEAEALRSLQARGWYPRGLQPWSIRDAKDRLRKRAISFPERKNLTR